MVVGVDEYSNYRFVKAIKEMTEARDAVIEVIHRAELESKRQVARIVTDQGTEYLNSDLRGALTAKEIGHVVSTATPHNKME